MDDSIAQLLSLDGKVALVTGAATGIGESIATVLAAAGAHVVVTDIDVDGAAKVAAAIEERGHRADAVHLDVTDEASARAGVTAAVESGGGLDILVNNAGSYHDAGSIVDQTYDSWRRAIAINYEGVFLCSKPAAEHMVARGQGGAIVTISSVDGIVPCLGTGYDSAKAALFQFTRSLAVDLAPFGIRANCVAPGNVPVETIRRMKSGELPKLWDEPSVPTGLMGPMATARSSNIPLGRKGLPEEISHAVLYLCSRAASYVTGQTLVVDGGWTLV
jgi:2-deoxy-D-gluconate 3-dehydrogenase